jgi:hypothetical protein
MVVTVPYGISYAVLCLLQGALVAPAWRRPFRLGRSRLVGVAVPIVVFMIGLAATRGADWSTEAVAHLATFATPVLAAAVGVVWGWRMPWAYAALALAAWVVAWRVDGLPADIAGVVLIAGACLTLAAVIGSFTPPWALATGLVVLAIVDAILVFADQVHPGTEALHAVVPVGAGGRPLPALQDATLDRSLFGWLDILAPALCAVLLTGPARRRLVAAVLTAVASLAFGLILAVSDQVPGTVPPLAAVAVWFVTRRSTAARLLTSP